MPVTRIETWVRDPYAVYARMILGLKPLDRPDTAMDGRARGSAIHRAFQDFAAAHADGPLADAAMRFEALLLTALEQAGLSEPAMARERALARRLAGWAASFEAERRASSPRLLIERSGKHAFTVQGRPFIVTAKADRIELADGLAHVLDFKTGAAPSRKQIETGFAPQLTLTAAILGREGFKDTGPVAPGDLVYVRVTGRRTPGEVLRPTDKTPSADLADAAFEGLVRRVARFNDPDRPYRSWEAPQFLSDRGGSDFDHLARVYEWRVAGGGDDEGADFGGGE
jgi:ATP-dependent helicase/nuclease subunit B